MSCSIASSPVVGADNPEYKTYVLGFIFSRHGHVLLMQKKRPDWQAGHYNGIGGKIEINESPSEAIIREAAEELKMAAAPSWVVCGTIYSSTWKVWVFAAEYNDKIEAAEDEPVGWFTQLPDNIIDNLKYLVPMCHSRLFNNENIFFRIQDGV